MLAMVIIINIFLMENLRRGEVFEDTMFIWEKNIFVLPLLPDIEQKCVENVSKAICDMSHRNVCFVCHVEHVFWLPHNLFK